MRDPHTTQNMQSSTRPLSVGRRQVRTSPSVSANAASGTITDIPNADADCRRHSRQWQT
jgi:hypothetical protein